MASSSSGRQFTEAELELARRIYDQMRYYVEVPPGMVDQIHRFGLLTKKGTLGDRRIRMTGTQNYYREYVRLQLRDLEHEP
jgi:hypothetical protein